jgi:ABC-type nickel/cobalt efflux system permease component RcnA
MFSFVETGQLVQKLGKGVRHMNTHAHPHECKHACTHIHTHRVREREREHGDFITLLLSFQGQIPPDNDQAAYIVA